MLLQVDFQVSHFSPLTAGHLGWFMRQQANVEVCFFRDSVSEGVVVRWLLGLQSNGILEVLVNVWLLHTEL